MIYFTAYETFRAGLAMLVFGVAFPMLEICLTLIFKIIKNSFYFLNLSYNRNVTFGEIRKKIRAEFKNKFAIFVLDFIIIISFFIFFILISYAFYDGILRIYFLLIAFFSCVLSRKLFIKFREILNKLIAVILTFLLFTLSFILMPIKSILHLILTLLKLLYIPLENRWKITLSRKRFKRKCKEISKFLQYI